MMIPFYFLVFFFPFSGSEEENSFGTEKSHNLYVPEHQNYIRAITEAKRNYKETSCANCSCYDHVIENDLAPFKMSITKEMIDRASSRGIKYQIIDKKVYRKSDCVFPSRCEGVDYFLNEIREELPDMEFVVNFHDWPQINRRLTDHIPVFSFSKTDDYLDIMYPAWSFWKGGPAIKLYPVGIGNWEENSKKIIKMGQKWPWAVKKDIVFFRGSRTSSERDNLILLSRSNPSLVDAAYTKNQAWKSEKDTLNMLPAEEVSLEDHCKYRYLFNFRGVAASFRLKYLFLCNSLVFHVGNEWKEFFYDSLKPWIHYIPVKSEYTMEDIEGLMNFFKNEEDLSKEIAERGFHFVSENLQIDNVICYWKKLLTKYKMLLKYKPKLDKLNVCVSI